MCGLWSDGLYSAGKALPPTSLSTCDGQSKQQIAEERKGGRERPEATHGELHNMWLMEELLFFTLKSESPRPEPKL